MTIDIGQISVHGNLWTNNGGNWHTTCRLDDQDLCSSAQQCWHLQQFYYRDGYLRIPIPATYNGRTMFTTAISPFTERAKCYIDEDGLTRIKHEHLNSVAKFAELIVVNKFALDQDGIRTKNREWEIVAFHGLPEKDIPPHYVEMAKNSSARGHLYRYTSEDYMRSVMFWSKNAIYN